MVRQKRERIKAMTPKERQEHRNQLAIKSVARFAKRSMLATATPPVNKVVMIDTIRIIATGPVRTVKFQTQEIQ